DDVNGRVVDHALGDLEHGLDVQAELDALDAGVGLGVRLGRQVRIHAEGHRGGLADRLGDIGQGVQLGFAFDIEQRHVDAEAVRGSGVRLRDAGEDDLRPGPAGSEGPVQFAAGGDVEPGTVFAHEPGDVDVRVGLNRVADERVGLGECRL